MRKVLVFGNGLGRAIDNNYYDLGKALEVAWSDPAILSDAQRELIQQCLPADVLEDENRIPKTEDELDTLQRILAACDQISDLQPLNGVGWLTPEGLEFPNAIRRYLHRAAAYFHDGPHALPKKFTEPLIKHVLKERSHIATLNYDDLLYRAFIGTEAFNGFSCLIDGFVPNFADGNLERFYPSSQSYYLHLHGSPLYYESRHAGIRKTNLGALPNLHGYSSTHIVLTHITHKQAVISASEILRAYWSKLEVALKESSGVMLIGYSGYDNHLNRLIRATCAEKQIEIVERKQEHDGSKEGTKARFHFWEKRLGQSPYIFWLDNVLDHTHWNWVAGSP